MSEDNKLVIKGDKGKKINSDLIVDCTGYSFSDIDSLLGESIKGDRVIKKAAESTKSVIQKTTANIKLTDRIESEYIEKGDGIVIRIGKEKIFFKINISVLSHRMGKD